MVRYLLAVAAVSGLLLAQPLGRPPRHKQASIDIGVASWYGARYAGRATASGERFDPNALTAAHRTLPFGTMVRVRDLEGGGTVVVKVNDRGPFQPGRLIDLSEAAARELSMRTRGVTRVSLEPAD